VAWRAGAAVVALRRPGLAAAAVAPYAAALAAASALTARSGPDRAARLRLPAAFAAMHIGWGVGFWEGFLRRTTKGAR
jgi:succinoglycan biosynthesis protein ExoA